jgi:hypothetical protein
MMVMRRKERKGRKMKVSLLDGVREQDGKKGDSGLSEETNDHLDQNSTSFEVFGQDHRSRLSQQTGSEAEQNAVSQRHLAELSGERGEQKT